MKNIQTNLLSAFDASGLTYDELAKRTNLPKSALYRYINGDTEKIPIDRFQSICNELHVDARSLLGWTSGGDSTFDLSEDETYLVNTFRSLPLSGKEYMLQQTRIARITFGEKPDIISCNDAK